MERQEIQKTSLITTEDGSSTIFNHQIQEHYHSIYGSYTESMHVYIETGLRSFSQKELVIFELGFGSGLNALLTLIESLSKGLKIKYLTIEKYPLTSDLYTNFQLSKKIEGYKNYFLNLHQANWDEDVEITKNFILRKIYSDWQTYTLEENINLVYYDAFSYDKQPFMWSLDRFEMLYKKMHFFGVLTTYSAKGIIKNNLRKVGFKVKRLPGIKGKRHIIKALKLPS